MNLNKANVLNNESSLTVSDVPSWCKNKFGLWIHYIFQYDKILSANESIVLDHSYVTPHGFRESRSNLEGNESDLIHDDEETVDAHANVEENHWNPVREVKEQFIIRTNPLTNHQISSFDLARIVEFNPDGSPVDKMHVFNSCAVHGEYEPRCFMCIIQPPIRPMFENATHSDHLRCIDNKVNRIPDRKRADDVTEEGENDDEKVIDELIADVKRKKRDKQPLVCGICEKKFAVASSLISHLRSHKKEKPFPCSLCERKFTRKTGLDYHMKVHKGEFRHTCSECSRQFRHTSHFKTHCKVHSMEKQQSSQPPSVLKNSSTLKKHLKIHSLR